MLCPVVGAPASWVGKACIVHGFSVLIKGASFHHVALTGFSLQSIEVLFVEVFLRVFDLPRKLLYGFCHSLLEPLFKQEQEQDEHKDVEDQQGDLEYEQVLVDEVPQLVLDVQCHGGLLPTDYLHVVLWIVVLVVCYVVEWTCRLKDIVLGGANHDCTVESPRVFYVFSAGLR